MAATSLHPIIHTGTNPYIHKSIQVHLLSQIHAAGGVFECCMRWLSQLTWSTLAVDEKGQRRAALTTSSEFGCYSYTNSGRVEKGGKGAALVLKGRTREGRGGEQHWRCCVGGERRGWEGWWRGGLEWSATRLERRVRACDCTAGECGEWLGFGVQFICGAGMVMA